MKKKKNTKDTSDTTSISEDGQELYVDTADTAQDTGAQDDLYMDTDQTEGDVYNDVADDSAGLFCSSDVALFIFLIFFFFKGHCFSSVVCIKKIYFRYTKWSLQQCPDYTCFHAFLGVLIKLICVLIKLIKIKI